MASTRPFTYNNGSPISGTNQIGDLAYGDKNPVNGGPNYDNNPGGKKWWMGPDEDNRYIIGKDVPTMDHPTATPEGNIGSVRFWGTDTQSNVEFLYWVNRLPGRAGLGPVSDPSTAYEWLLSNGYFTNYPPVFNEFGTFYTYGGPTDTSSQALGLIYSSNQNILYINVDGGTNTRGPFSIDNWTSTVDNTISGSTIHYSGSTYQSDWLQPVTTGGPFSTTIYSGYLALAVLDYDFLFNCDMNKGISKYDISFSPPVPDASNTNIPEGNTVKINVEPSSSLLIATNGNPNATGGSITNTSAWVYDADDLSYITLLQKANGQTLTNTRFATPGPSGYILLNREYSSTYNIFHLTGTDPYKSIYNGEFSSGYQTERDLIQPVYVASKNKWYVPFKIKSYVGPNVTVSQGLDVIDGSTYAKTGYTFGSQTNNTGQKQGVKAPIFFLYDSSRDYFWTTSPVDRSIIAIDADNFTTQITTTTNGRTIGYTQGSVLVDDKIIMIRPDSGNPIKVFDLSIFV